MIVSLSIQECALSRQIESSERRAERMSKSDCNDKSCPYWSKVEKLLHQQDVLMGKIAKLNDVGYDNEVRETQSSQTFIGKVIDVESLTTSAVTTDMDVKVASKENIVLELNDNDDNMNQIDAVDNNKKDVSE